MKKNLIFAGSNLSNNINVKEVIMNVKRGGHVFLIVPDEDAVAELKKVFYAAADELLDAGAWKNVSKNTMKRVLNHIRIVVNADVNAEVNALIEKYGEFDEVYVEDVQEEVEEVEEENSHVGDDFCSEEFEKTVCGKTMQRVVNDGNVVIYTENYK